jgi:hypothetical protein
MPCDTQLKPRQTIQQRADEVRRAVSQLSTLIAAGRVKVNVSQKGGVAFEGWNATERDGVTDACAYRRLMVSGSALAKAAIARAEQIAGRSVDKVAIGNGLHSHDGGVTWHDHKG